MKLDVNIKGLTELKARLEALATTDATKAGQSAVRAGGKVGMAGIRAETPVSDVEEGATHRRTRRNGTTRDTIHHKIVNNLKVKKKRTDKQTQVAVAITTGAAFQARFVEWGTIHQHANDFMGRGLQSVQQEVIDAMAVQLERQIIKREPSSDVD